MYLQHYAIEDDTTAVLLPEGKGQAGNDLPMPAGETISVSYQKPVFDEDGKLTGFETASETATVVTEAYAGTGWGADDGQEHWYVVNSNVNLPSRITVTGNVHLILADSCTLDAQDGIGVDAGNSLTIYAQSTGSGMGALTATGKMGAGIGGGYGGSTGGNGGEIAITGGKVTVDGKAGADIGGGKNNNNDDTALSDKIEIGGDADVKVPGGRDLTIGFAEHEATDEWDSDSTHHWRRCKKEGCNDRFGQKAHEFGEWITDQEATDTTAGSKRRECDICQYQETEDIPPTHSHSYGQTWVSNAAGHWLECSCGNKSDYAAHTPAPQTCTKPQTCAVCGYRMAEALNHNWGGWVSNGDGTHTRTCQRDPSHTETGDCSGEAAACETAQICATCGYQIAAALGHDYGEMIPAKEATTASAGMKAHYCCSRCGNYFDENKNPTSKPLVIYALSDLLIN